MDKSLAQFFSLLDTAGQLPTEIDRQLGQARAVLPADHPAFPFVKAAHDATAKLGQALVALEDWGKPADAPVFSGGESWNEYHGFIPAWEVDTQDCYLIVTSTSNSQNAFNWKPIISATADEIKEIYRRGIEVGRHMMDTPQKVLEYTAHPTRVYLAYLERGGKPL